jgi:hypothetical protein
VTRSGNRRHKAGHASVRRRIPTARLNAMIEEATVGISSNSQRQPDNEFETDRFESSLRSHLQPLVHQRLTRVQGELLFAGLSQDFAILLELAAVRDMAVLLLICCRRSPDWLVPAARGPWSPNPYSS